MGNGSRGSKIEVDVGSQQEARRQLQEGRGIDVRALIAPNEATGAPLAARPRASVTTSGAVEEDGELADAENGATA